MSYRSERSERQNKERQRKRILVILVVSLILVAIGVLAYQGFSSKNKAHTMKLTVSGLKYEDFIVGEGEEVGPGDKLVVQYTGWLRTGEVFDSSFMRDQPFEFTLGTNQVIEGWNEGLVGMKVGGKRRLVVPRNLSYGMFPIIPVIPPDSYVTFDIELLEIK